MKARVMYVPDSMQSAFSVNGPWFIGSIVLALVTAALEVYGFVGSSLLMTLVHSTIGAHAVLNIYWHVGREGLYASDDIWFNGWMSALNCAVFVVTFHFR